MRRTRQHWQWPAVFAAVCFAAIAPTVALGVDHGTAGKAERSQRNPTLHLALQPCRFPQRFETCRFDCERQKRRIEKNNGCWIDISRDGSSTCRERLVDLVRQCFISCHVEFCPQFHP